jgi:predicted DNA-binding protein YlxM (UPF0122 family)
MELEKKFLLTALFDFYGALLTEKQQAIFQSYILDDYSLKETSEAFDVSRSAVFDAIQKIENHLLHYETMLKLHEKSQARKVLLDQIEDIVDISIMNKLRELEG